MSSGWTNRGKIRYFELVKQRATMPDFFNIALITGANVPDAKTNVFSELIQIAIANGYTDGGYQVSPNDTDFDVLTEEDSTDKALIQIKDVTWTATGGPIPGSGDPARYVVLLDNNAVVANREVLAYWDLLMDRQVSTGQPFTLQNLQLTLSE